jgi:hypothetical protein
MSKLFSSQSLINLSRYVPGNMRRSRRNSRTRSQERNSRTRSQGRNSIAIWNSQPRMKPGFVPIEIHVITYSIIELLRENLKRDLNGFNHALLGDIDTDHLPILTNEQIENYRYVFLMSLRDNDQDILEDICLKYFDLMVEEMKNKHQESLHNLSIMLIFIKDNPGYSGLPTNPKKALEDNWGEQQMLFDNIIHKYFKKPHMISIDPRNLLTT